MMRHDQRLFYMANPALNRELATSELVEAAALSISDDKVFSKMLLFGPFKTSLWADAVVTITFPDPILLELGKVGDRDRADVLRLQQLKVLGALDAAVNYLKTGYRVPHVSDDFRHAIKIMRTTGESENNGEVLVEVVRLTVNLIDFDSIGLLKDLAATLLRADALQLARDIQIVVNVRGSIDKINIDGELFDGKAERRPVSTWLTLEHKAEVLAFFSLPEVAAMVAEGCRDKLVTCDKMNKGAAVEKRANLSEGNPITIIEPGDVPGLVDAMDFGAFYPNVERNDGLIGRLVCDLDMGHGFTGLLGPQRAWEAEIGVYYRRLLHLNRNPGWKAFRKSSERDIIYEILNRLQKRVYQENSLQNLDIPISIVSITLNPFLALGKEDTLQDNLSGQMYYNYTTLSKQNLLGQVPRLPAKCLGCGNPNSSELAPLNKFSFSYNSGARTFNELTIPLNGYWCKEKRYHLSAFKRKSRTIKPLWRCLSKIVRWRDTAMFNISWARNTFWLIGIKRLFYGFNIKLNRTPDARNLFTIITHTQDVADEIMALNTQYVTHKIIISTAVISLGLLETAHDANKPRLNQERIVSSGVKEAIDNPSLTIINGGDAFWYEQYSVWFIGGSAARCGDINDSQQSWFQTTVSAPFNLSFSWKVSSEQYCDYLSFYIDDIYVNQISGDIEWQNVSIEVAGTGSRTLRWEYSKNSLTSWGSDAGFVDSVQIGAYIIKPRNFNVWDPSASTQWYTNVYYYIQWSMSPNILTSIDITLYKGMSAVATIASAISSNLYGYNDYYWHVPTSIVAGSDYHVRVADHYNIIDFDDSSDFTINNTKTISIFSPTNSTIWLVAQQHNIYYQATGLSSVDIDLYKGGGMVTSITSNVNSNNPTYWWTVPKTLMSGTDYRVRVMEHGNASVYRFSDYFTINATKTIDVISPSSGCNYWVEYRY
nr:Ser-Thr-rich GPI-anchored membrane family protein [Candidatus Sigynarchaeum springense]